MGTYATSTSIATLLVDFPTLNTASTSLIGKCITHAENEVNKYLSRRYDTTAWISGTVPPLVTSLTETYAEGLLWMRMSRGGKDSIARGQTLIDMALQNLKDIAAYKANLIDSDGSLTDARTTNLGVLGDTDDYMTTFAEDDPLNWEIDATKLSDIETSRE